MLPRRRRDLKPGLRVRAYVIAPDEYEEFRSFKRPPQLCDGRIIRRESPSHRHVANGWRHARLDDLLERK